MMRMNLHTLLLLTACLAVTACKKDKEEDPAPTTPTPSNTHRATLSASRSVSDLGMGPTESSTATAFFHTSAGEAVNVDSVHVNGMELGNFSTGMYVASSFAGLDLSTETLVWDVSFDASDIAFTHSASEIGYPTVSAITSGGNAPRGSSYTLSCGTVTGADSVQFTLGSLVRTLPGNATSHTFTAAEVGSMGSEEYTASIRAMRRQTATYSGMACVFLKTSSYTVMVLVE